MISEHSDIWNLLWEMLGKKPLGKISTPGHKTAGEIYTDDNGDFYYCKEDTNAVEVNVFFDRLSIYDNVGRTPTMVGGNALGFKYDNTEINYGGNFIKRHFVTNWQPAEYSPLTTGRTIIYNGYCYDGPSGATWPMASFEWTTPVGSFVVVDMDIHMYSELPWMEEASDIPHNLMTHASLLLNTETKEAMGDNKVVMNALQGNIVGYHYGLVREFQHSGAADGVQIVGEPGYLGMDLPLNGAMMWVANVYYTKLYSWDYATGALAEAILYVVLVLTADRRTLHMIPRMVVRENSSSMNGDPIQSLSTSVDWVVDWKCGVHNYTPDKTIASVGNMYNWYAGYINND